MISINDNRNITTGEIKSLANTLCFVGPSIDQRGDDLTSALNTAAHIVEVSFNVQDYTVDIDGTKVGTIGVNRYINDLVQQKKCESIYIESTTLGFVEVLLLLKWFSRSEIDSLQVIYAEPNQYKSRTNYMNDFGKHEFDLSTHTEGFKAIPGFAKALTQSKKAILISSMGFERSRLGQLLSQDDGAYIHAVIPVFGTPPYQTGWDKHSFFQNVDVLNDKGEKPQFVAANSPIDMLEMLEYIKGSYSEDDEITLAPLGTKPLSIASAVFLINNPQVTLKYDHPKRKGRRSTGLGKIHLYEISKQ
ncbi:hypothetical protein [Thalassomonas haliotis]|uniref:Uncharacterized protein n=1 Tax=Thalassomonas haliotis TaxID=485448 RepID=A0ABY7VF57_9GAMM|nr:hypothetical protein [Thalassomonas haliotis]WDE12036.1 hypothetical protein H3N35_00650 [Thalassomonas haliotis]